ncbi:MAG: hypothetical protein JWR74_3258 [Polaromonas sp.]|jgi:hypothetical protein|nr:hypothetical protein [Polaromonas sp.]
MRQPSMPPPQPLHLTRRLRPLQQALAASEQCKVLFWKLRTPSRSRRH